MPSRRVQISAEHPPDPRDSTHHRHLGHRQTPSSSIAPAECGECVASTHQTTAGRCKECTHNIVNDQGMRGDVTSQPQQQPAVHPGGVQIVNITRCLSKQNSVATPSGHMLTSSAPSAFGRCHWSGGGLPPLRQSSSQTVRPCSGSRQLARTAWSLLHCRDIRVTLQMHCSHVAVSMLSWVMARQVN